jgi:mono/diheme cytochrome c family protein
MRTFIYSTLIVLCICSCSARRVAREWQTSASEDPAVKEGRLVFKSKCQRCHPNGEAGVAPPLNNIRLPRFFLKARVRSRAVLLWTGRMPAFDKHEISKKELKSLVTFLKAMEKGKNKNEQ